MALINGGKFSNLDDFLESYYVSVKKNIEEYQKLINLARQGKAVGTVNQFDKTFTTKSVAELIIMLNALQENSRINVDRPGISIIPDLFDTINAMGFDLPEVVWNVDDECIVLGFHTPSKELLISGGDKLSISEFDFIEPSQNGVEDATKGQAVDAIHDFFRPAKKNDEELTADEWLNFLSDL
jgi:hypothetical protein